MAFDPFSLLPTLLGGFFGMQSANAQADAMQDEGNRTSTQSSMPQWSPQQLPYVFGDNAWQPQMPQMNAEALNYGQALMGGFNPAYGPQQPMGFDELLAQISGTPQAPKTEGGGWFQDPNSTVYNPQGNAGGVEGLLGYGAGTPPPLFDNNPYFAGQGVRDPENMMQGPGMPNIMENQAMMEAEAAAQQEQQAPQQPQAPAPLPQAAHWSESPQANAMLFGAPEGTTASSMNPNAVDPWGQYSRTPGGGPSLQSINAGLLGDEAQQAQSRQAQAQILMQSGLNPADYGF